MAMDASVTTASLKDANEAIFEVMLSGKYAGRAVYLTFDVQEAQEIAKRLGVDEDSVTGSAHSLLTPFWVERLGRNNLRAHQASARGGDLTLRLAKDDSGDDAGGDRAWLGGPCVTVVKGEFYLSG